MAIARGPLASRGLQRAKKFDTNRISFKFAVSRCNEKWSSQIPWRSPVSQTVIQLKTIKLMYMYGKHIFPYSLLKYDIISKWDTLRRKSDMRLTNKHKDIFLEFMSLFISFFFLQMGSGGNSFDFHTDVGYITSARTELQWKQTITVGAL